VVRAAARGIWLVRLGLVPGQQGTLSPGMIHLMLNRLQPKGTDAEFHYRQAA
jgi:hypothetical protein